MKIHCSNTHIYKHNGINALAYLQSNIIYYIFIVACIIMPLVYNKVVAQTITNMESKSIDTPPPHR